MEKENVKSLFPNQQKNRLHELDAFRGIAAILVVLFHFTNINDYGGIFSLGLTGVDLFFIISGFVIFLTLEKTTTWKDFVINRSSRLFPTYWVCVTITAALMLLVEHPGMMKLVRVYLANLTMVQTSLFDIGDLDGVYWTMTVEMIFYILMLCLFQFELLKQIEWIGVGLVILCFFNGWYLKPNFIRIYEALNFRIPLISHFPLFYAGVIFYKMKFTKKKNIHYVLLLISYCVQAYLCDKGGSKASPIFSSAKYASILAVYYISFFIYINWGMKFIVNKVTLFLGNISYSLYLVHKYIGQKIVIPLMQNNFYINKSIVLLITLSVVIALAFLINLYIEKPAMNFIRNRKLKIA